MDPGDITFSKNNSSWNAIVPQVARPSDTKVSQNNSPEDNTLVPQGYFRGTTQVAGPSDPTISQNISPGNNTQVSQVAGPSDTTVSQNNLQGGRWFMSIESITKSLEATFRNYSLDTDKIDWTCPETGPIKEILYKNRSSRATDFALEEKIKKKGRKPKPKQVSAPISDLTFNLRRESHRRVKKDSYSRTSQDCEEHENCEIIYKTYNVSIFGKGKIVCVGITEENCEDFDWCVKIITDFLISKGYDPRDLEIVRINKTLENFKFRLKDEERKIDLIAVNNFFVNNYHRGEIANVELDRLLLFFIKKIKNNDMEFCPVSMMKTFDEFSELKYFLIHKSDLLEFFKSIDLPRMYCEIERIYEKLSSKHTNILNYELDMFLRKMVIRSYINYHCIQLLRKCTQYSYKVAKNVVLDNDKNTIELLITVNNKDITVKLFSSGKVNILGAKNIDQIRCIYSNLERLLDENPGIVYHTDDW